MSKFTIKDNNIKIPVDVDFNALKKKFENSEHFKRFEEIKSTKQFTQMYQDCFEKYQKVVMSVKEISAKEKAELCDIDNIWNCFYANALCNLYSIALERYLRGDAVQHAPVNNDIRFRVGHAQKVNDREIKLICKRHIKAEHCCRRKNHDTG